jgi:hypothetical protein
MSWNDVGGYHIVDASWDVEIEEREEQLYQSDGTTPVTKTHESGPAEGKKTKVKLKRYFWRKVLKVTESMKVADQFDTPPSGFGGKIGDMTNSPGFEIPGDSGMHYLCTNERAQCTDTVVGLWLMTRSWTAYSKWESVPKDWNLDQKTDLDDEDSGS